MSVCVSVRVCPNCLSTSTSSSRTCRTCTHTRISAPPHKVYEELLFEYDEMVVIEKMLRARIREEKEGLAAAEADVHRLGVVPTLEPQLAAIDDQGRLQTLLDSEMNKMDILEEEM
jgi:hypothetical protein